MFFLATTWWDYIWTGLTYPVQFMTTIMHAPAVLWDNPAAIRAVWVAFAQTLFDWVLAVIPSSASDWLDQLVTEMMLAEGVEAVLHLAAYFMGILIEVNVVLIMLSIILMWWMGCLILRLGLVIYHNIPFIGASE